MLNLDFSDNITKLNFIGVVSLFGGEITLSALRYSVLIQDAFLSLYFTMVLSPGLQTVSLRMFKRMEGKVSQAISGGQREGQKSIVGLSSNGGYKYVGLHSGTKMTIGSILGETLVASHKPTGNIDVPCTREKSPKRDLKLKVIELGALKTVDNEGTSNKKYGPRIHARRGPYGLRSVLLHIIPLITVAGVVITILAEDYIVVALILLNMICNMLVTFVIRSNGIRYPVGHSALGSPQGDIFVENSDGTEMCLIIGKEDTIQYLFQKSLIMPPNPKDAWDHLHMLTAYLSYIAVVINIVLLPFSTGGGAIVFGILIFFGVIQNVLLSTFDGDELLLEIVKDLCPIESCKEYTFQTRSSAVAFCMLKSKCSDINTLRHMLPSTKTFEAWFQNVVNHVNGTVKEDLVLDGLLNNLDIDLKDAFNIYNKKDEHVME